MKQLTIMMISMIMLVSCSKPSVSPGVTSTSPPMNSIEQSLVGNWITNALVVNNTDTATKYNNVGQDHLYLFNTGMTYTASPGTWYTSQGSFIFGNISLSVPWKASGDSLWIGAGTPYIVQLVTAHSLILLSPSTNSKYLLSK